MKCNVSRKDLMRLLERCKSGTDPKSAEPALHCVLLRASGETLSAFGTTLQTSVYTDCQCAVTEEGAAAVSIEKLRNAVKAMPDGMVSLKVDHAKLATTVTCTGQRKYTIHGINPDHYPVRELAPKNLDWFTIPSKTCKEAIERTRPAASTDADRKNLNGIQFEFSPKLMRAIGFNGYIMSCFEHPNAYDHVDGAVFLPYSTIALIMSTDDDISLAYTDRAVFVNAGVDRVSALLPQTPFPPWKNVREQCSTTLQCRFDVQQLILAVRAVTAVTRSDVQLDLKRSTLHLKLVNVPDSESEDAVQVDAEPGAKFTVTLNPEYLLNVLQGCGGGIGELRFSMKETYCPVAFSADDGFFGVVTPVAPVQK